ncbi:MAG: hypothetical protein M3331_05060 [Actinomycetota bacterium]|nr:hypothetical protein [Actinomycetota bacterium]
MLTLEASKKQLKPARTTDLSGTLSGAFNGDAGRTITLLATPYPYESESVAGTTTTDSGGKFSFPNVDPDLNTRYRVSFGAQFLEAGATSRTVQIFRFPRGDVDLNVTRDGYVEARLDFFYSDKVQPEYYVGRRDLHWYFGKTTADRYKRVARVKFEDTARGVGGDIRYRLPRSRKGYRFLFFPCVEAPAADIGIGNDKPSQCPDSFRARRGSRSATPPSSRTLGAPVTAYAE